MVRVIAVFASRSLENLSVNRIIPDYVSLVVVLSFFYIFDEDEILAVSGAVT